jgi:hypothetical protein
VRRRIPAAIAVALCVTLIGGLAAAASRSGGGAKACVNKRGDLRLLTDAKCPAGDRLTRVGRATRAERDDVSEANGQTALATRRNAVKAIVGLESLPAGSWVLTSQLTVVNFGRADYFRCKIVIGAKQIASGASTVGTPRTGTPGVPSAASSVAGISLIGAAGESKSFTALLECWHDLKTKGATPYIDPGAVLLARPVGSLSARTH